MLGKQVDIYVGDEWRGTRSVEPETNPCEPTAYHAIEPPSERKRLLSVTTLPHPLPNYAHSRAAKAT